MEGLCPRLEIVGKHQAALLLGRGFPTPVLEAATPGGSRFTILIKKLISNDSVEHPHVQAPSDGAVETPVCPWTSMRLPKCFQHALEVQRVIRIRGIFIELGDVVISHLWWNLALPSSVSVARPPDPLTSGCMN